MNDIIYIAILIGLGLYVAYTTSRSVNRREPTQGGGAASVFQYLASGLIAMLAPTVLCNIIFIHPRFLGTVEIAGINLTVIAHVVVIALVMIGLALLMLVIYAALEKPHLVASAEEEDAGWTREDAEASGL